MKKRPYENLIIYVNINIYKYKNVVSKIQQFPGHNYGEVEHYSVNTSRSTVSPCVSDIQICPARSSEELAIEEDKNFDGSSVSPWSVKQTDSMSNDFEVIS